MNFIKTLIKLAIFCLALIPITASAGTHHPIDHIPEAGSHVEHDHIELWDNTNLNPTQRIARLKTELYPELYNRPTAQNLTDSYKLPFSAPAYAYVTQGYFGPFSHTNTRAVDFFGNNLKVAVARKGVVISANFGGKWDNWCNSYQDCYNKGGIWNGNHVLVEHNDGSYAMYLHMESGTLRPGITVGSPVRQGTILGDFGATGYTCGNSACSSPGIHLHYQVNSVPGVTVSTPFEDCNENINLGDCDSGIPRQSTTYTSFNYPPGVESLSGEQNAIYFLGTDRKLLLDAIVPGSGIKLSNATLNQTKWELNPETNRIEGNYGYCLADTGEIYLRAVNCSNNSNQNWEKAFQYNIQNSQTNRCFESQNGSSIGSFILLSSCSQNNPNQFFRLSSEALPISTTPANLITNNIYDLD